MTNRSILALAAALAALAVAAACGGAHDALEFGGDGGDDGDDASADRDGGAGPAPSFGNGGGPFHDFPAPIVDGTAPPNAPTLFGPPAGAGAKGGGPCLVEPEADALYPNNWLRPRFRWTTASGANLFELRLHVANQSSDLVVYTGATTWTMPRPLWDALRAHSVGASMTVTVRGGTYDGKALHGVAVGSSGPIGVAPVAATGAIVYWTTTGGSALKGFSPGDESVTTVLSPSHVQTPSAQCIGCHTSTPDGAYVGLSLLPSQQTNEWPNAVARIDRDGGALGAPPPFLGDGGAAALARWNQGIGAFSPAHWSSGDRREIVTYDDEGAGATTLSWIDLEASDLSAATGTIARQGDPASAGAPAWSHDGATIAYVSTNRPCNGRVGRCDDRYQAPDDPGSTADLYTVPYAGGAGGAATPVAGASEASHLEYYPAFSPDDRLLAFTRAETGLNMYDQPAAEVMVVPAKGGAATRLAANDPPQCTHQRSPGVTNSWPKWGPSAETVGGSTYYWLVFSSTRSDSGHPQLYVTSIVRDAAGALTTHGAIYLWNQPPAENNHTPAWDAFRVPPVPPPR